MTGVRKTENQVYRELASRLSYPVSLKNRINESFRIAFGDMAKQGVAETFETKSNTDVHVILRGSTTG